MRKAVPVSDTFDFGFRVVEGGDVRGGSFGAQEDQGRFDGLIRPAVAQDAGHPPGDVADRIPAFARQERGQLPKRRVTRT